jgi:hypothetical protein
MTQRFTRDLLRCRRRRGRHANPDKVLGEAPRDVGTFVRFERFSLFAPYKLGRQLDGEILGSDAGLPHNHSKTADRDAVSRDRARCVIPRFQTVFERFDVLVQTSADPSVHLGSIVVAIHQFAPLLLEQGAGTADDKCARLCSSASRVMPRFKDVDYWTTQHGGSAFFSADLDLMLEVREGHAAYIGSAPSLLRNRQLTEDRSLRFQLQTGWQQ